MRRELSIKSLIFDGAGFAFLISFVLYHAFQPTEDELLNLSHLSIFLLGALFSGLAAAALLQFFKVRTLGVSVFATEVHEVRPWYKTFSGHQLWVLLAIALYASAISTDFDLYEIFSQDGIGGARRIFTSLLNPEFSVLPRAVLAIYQTVCIAFLATILAVPVAFVLSFFCAKNIVGKNLLGFALYTILRLTFNISRSVEPLIWAIIFSVWVGIGPFAGMLALMLHSISSLTKNYSELIECVDEGPIEGIQSTGARPFQVVWFGVVPQIVLPYVAFTFYRWDINVRMATVIGLVGGGGIGVPLIQYQGQAMWREVGCIVLVIAIVVWLMDTISAYLREALK